MGTEDDTGQWVTIDDAAKAAGVSYDTVRRRLKRGEIEGRREATPQGFRWLVRAQETEPARSEDVSAQGASEPAIVITADHEMIDTLRQELAMRNREIAHLHEIIATQAQTIARVTALPAGNVPSGDSRNAPVNTSPVEAEGGAIEPPAPHAAAYPSSGSELSQRGVLMRVWDWLRGSDAP
jgi:hypothetical protein